MISASRDISLSLLHVRGFLCFSFYFEGKERLLFSNSLLFCYLLFQNLSLPFSASVILWSHDGSCCVQVKSEKQELGAEFSSVRPETRWEFSCNKEQIIQGEVKSGGIIPHPSNASFLRLSSFCRETCETLVSGSRRKRTSCQEKDINKQQQSVLTWPKCVTWGR